MTDEDGQDSNKENRQPKPTKRVRFSELSTLRIYKYRTPEESDLDDDDFLPLLEPSSPPRPDLDGV